MTTDILFVDDEPIIHDVIDAAFGETHSIDHARNLAEARAALTRKPYALVLVDKNLPDGSGLDLGDDARRHNPYCELIMVTAFANLDSAKTAIRLGFYDYVTKPFDIDILRSRVTAAIFKHGLRRAHSDTVASMREIVASAAGGVFEIEASVRAMVEHVPAVAQKLASLESTLAEALGRDESLHALLGMEELLAAVTGLEEQLKPVQDLERHFSAVKRCIADLDALTSRDTDDS